RGELLGAGQLAAGPHRELAPRALHAPARNLGILLAKGALDVLHGHAAVGHPLGIQPDAHRVAPPAADEDGAHAGDVLEALLEDVRDLRVDDAGARAAIERGDRDDRRIDVGVFANREAAEPDHPEDDDREAHHRREYRPLDRDFAEFHFAAPPRSPTGWL